MEIAEKRRIYKMCEKRQTCEGCEMWNGWCSAVDENGDSPNLWDEGELIAEMKGEKNE